MHPDLCKNWSTLNSEGPEFFTYGSNYKAYWKCSKGHPDYQAPIKNYVRGLRCPYCRGLQVCLENSFGYNYPEFTKEWSDKNEKTPYEYSAGSKKAVYWRCLAGKNHPDYLTEIITKRTQPGCPYCAGARVCRENSVGYLYPELIKEWGDKNTQTPFEFTKGSHHKAWWKCSNTEHPEYKSMIKSRVNGTGCPYCARIRILKDNSFADLHPEISIYWSSRNSTSPNQYLDTSYYQALWKCPNNKDHPDYKFGIRYRISKAGCPLCSPENSRRRRTESLQSEFPEIIKRWSSKNILSPNEVTSGSGRKAWWICLDNQKHPDYESRISTQSRGGGCPYCAGTSICYENSLACLSPDIAKEWSDKNERKASEVTRGSDYKAWWKCSTPDHPEYEMAVYNRTAKGQGCPYCSGNKVCKSNSLGFLRPEVAKYWSSKNSKTIWQVRPGSNITAWWSCPDDKHEDYQRPVIEQAKSLPMKGSDNRCPYCTGARLHKTNCFAAVCPDLVAEWSLENEKTPYEVTPYSNYKAKWVCSINSTHNSWITTVGHRTRGSGCPECRLIQRSAIEIKLSYELSEFFSIDVEKTRLAGQDELWYVDILMPDEKVVVEYDGSYHHKSKKHTSRDRKKNRDLEAVGWTVLRIREEPLPLVRNHDVQISNTASPKEIVDITLQALEKLNIISQEEIQSYLDQDNLWHITQAQEYINLLKKRGREIPHPGSK